MTANEDEHVQLVHNEWVEGRSKTRVLYGFGRKDQLNTALLERLVRSILRYLDADRAQAIREEHDLETPFEFLGAKTYGGAFVLDALWERLGIKRTLRKFLSGRGFATPIERLLFALVAQRALDPGGKLAAERWLGERAFIPGLPKVEVHQLYRAMDFLLEAHDEIQREVFWSVRNPFNLEVDVPFIDTTSAYLEIAGEDPGREEREEAGNDEDEAAGERARQGLRNRSQHSEDSRPDLAQALIGFAVARDGIPVKCWVWPGNTGDAFIIGEKMRLGKDGKPPAALESASQVPGGLYFPLRVASGHGGARLWTFSIGLLFAGLSPSDRRLVLLGAVRRSRTAREPARGRACWFVTRLAPLPS